MVRSIDVISRPNDARDVTSRSLKRHMYGWCVWALTTRSTAGSSRLTTLSRSGPVKFSHLFTSMKPREKGAFCWPPSCRSSTIVLTLRCFSRATSALTVSASSRKLEPGDAGRRDDQRRPLERLADEGDLLAVEVLTIRYGGRSGLSGARVGDVRREVLEDGAVERRAVLAAVDRMTAVDAGRYVGRAAVGAAAAGCGCRTASAAARPCPRRTRGCRRRSCRGRRSS